MSRHYSPRQLKIGPNNENVNGCNPYGNLTAHALPLPPSPLLLTADVSGSITRYGNNVRGNLVSGELGEVLHCSVDKQTKPKAYTLGSQIFFRQRSLPNGESKTCFKAQY